jgi:hypothetical protein
MRKVVPYRTMIFQNNWSVDWTDLSGSARNLTRIPPLPASLTPSSLFYDTVPILSFTKNLFAPN